MQSASYATPLLLSTPCADLTLLGRDCSALRMLRLMQAWGAEHIIEPGRGAVWIAREWLCAKLGVSKSQYYRALGRLRSGGWIEASTVPDSGGRELPGYRVALVSASGFATQMRPTCDLHATQMRPTCDFPTSKLKQENLNSDQSSSAQMSRRPRQSGLPGVKVEMDTRPITTLSGRPKRDPALRPIAIRIDEYERQRYSEHPRCVRPKRGTVQAIDIAVEAIVRALERVVESGLYPSLEAIEERFMAAIELNWDAAERKIETWVWWTGSALWAPHSLERVLGWLEDERNAVYLRRARGEDTLPRRAQADAEPVRELSPLEQQAEYDRRHGVTPEPTIAELVGSGLKTVEPGVGTCVLKQPRPDPTSPPIEIERASQALSESLDRQRSERVFRKDMELARSTVQPRVKSDDELRAESLRKSEYMKSTTPEQRSADAKSGRKPWEVG